MIHAEDISQTAFTMGYGLYEYLVMSFGLMNAPTHFIYLMNSVFMSELDQFIVVFIDDILVYLKSMEEHEGHLELYFNVSESISCMLSSANTSSRLRKPHSWVTWFHLKESRWTPAK
jgi:hypothetical protein